MSKHEQDMNERGVGAAIKEINVDLKTTRRNFLGLAVGATAAASLAACSGATPGGSSAAASYWYLTGQPGEAVRKGAIDRFNKANPGHTVTGTTFSNDVYPTKLRSALGAGQGPSLVWGWGGGVLRNNVKNGQLEDLTSFISDHPSLKSRRFASSFDAATVDSKIYALPGECSANVVLYYNKRVFDKAGAEPPKTWADVMNLVDVFTKAGVAPFALAGQSRWPEMHFVEFLLDRIGGSGIFQNVLAGKADAWSDPAVTDTLTKCQELVRAGGFAKGFASTAADANADQALFYTGRAAMLLQGTWTFGNMKASGGDFVSSGGLGYMNFPAVEGGKGDPSMTVGNPGQYLSINAKASSAQKATARKFLLSWLDKTEVAGWVKTGQVPVVTDAKDAFTSSPDKDFLNFAYDISSNAKPFVQTWDQALSPTQIESVLDNISKLFQLSISPTQWIDSMNKVIGK